jgi:uncharacterized repeat protein (TIGR03987 family)
MEIAAAILITLALIFYSLGVWSEKMAAYLKKWHVVMFWIGFSFDVGGTTLMHFIAENPFDLWKPHTLTGQLALWLMLAHAIWATRVIQKDNIKLRLRFHRYSLAVWIIWLVPYFGGMMMGMRG